MMSREQTIECLKERLINQAKRRSIFDLSNAIAYSTGYMPDLTLEEFSGLIELLKEKYNIRL